MTPVSRSKMHSLLSIPGVVPAARLERPAAQTVPSGIAAVDRLIGGLPRGALTQIYGVASSGRTTLFLSALAEATHRRELCALVDAGDSFDPQVAAMAGLDLDRLLWVRCSDCAPRCENGVCNLGSNARNDASPWQPGDRRTERGRRRKKFRDAWFERLEQALKAADLLLQAGGFGLVALDLADVPAGVARHVPLASWFRFSRAVEHTPAVLLVIAEQAYAGVCAALTLRTAALPAQLAGTDSDSRQSHASSIHPVLHICAADVSSPVRRICAADAGGVSHARLLRGLCVEVSVVRARELKKAPSSASTKFESRAEWA